MVIHASNPWWRQVDTWASWPARLAESRSSGFSARYCLENQGENRLMKTPNFDLWPLHVCNMCTHVYDCMYTYTKNLPFQTGPCMLTLVLWASRLKPSSSNQAQGVAESSTQSQGGPETWSCPPETPPFFSVFPRPQALQLEGVHSFRLKSPASSLARLPCSC